MRAIRAKNTKPELLVRSAAHALGLRFRLYRDDLPGRPDLTFPSRKTVALVHGCFWHQHAGCKKSSLPKTNREFWKQKLDRNVERDLEVIQKLTELGWATHVIWECEVKNLAAASSLLRVIFSV